MQNGKGDTYRIANRKAWEANYERIFGKKAKSKSKARKKIDKCKVACYNACQ